MTDDLTTPEVCNGIGSEIYNRIQFEDLRPWLDSNISDDEYKLKFKAEKLFQESNCISPLKSRTEL